MSAIIYRETRRHIVAVQAVHPSDEQTPTLA